MIDWIGSLPLLPAIGLLWVIVLCRAGGTYLLGRGAHRLAHRGRLARLIESPSVDRALGIVQRYGAPVVALSFLTVGFQTAANLSAGLIRMPVIRYLPALLIGGLAWAVIYATVGLAVVVAWLELFLLSPWAAVLVLVLVLAAVAALIVRRRRRRAAGAVGVVDGADVVVAAAEAAEETTGGAEEAGNAPAPRPEVSPREPASERRQRPRSGGHASRTR